MGEFVLFLEEQFLDPVSFVQVSLSLPLSPQTLLVLPFWALAPKITVSILKLLFFRFQNPGLAPLSLSLATNVKLLKSFLIVH